MYFIFAKMKQGASPTHAWPVYVQWQQLYGRKPRQAGQGLERVSGLQPLLAHNAFLQSSLGSPQLTINSWCTLQSCFISFRSDKLQRRSVAVAPQSREAGCIWDFSPMLTSRPLLKTNWLIYTFYSKHPGRLWVNFLGQAAQKHMGWKCLIGFQYPLVKWR